MLTDQEYKKLEPMADRAAEHLQINANPVTTFMVVSVLTYGQKLFMISKIKKDAV